MRLRYAEIRDYRSIFVDDAGQPLRLDLADGANTLVGQNNCGKSNVLRAISLAMDPHHVFVDSDDAPGPRPFSLPILTLGFSGHWGDEHHLTVLNAAQAYELSLGISKDRTRASRGEVVLQVSFVPDAAGARREETLIVDEPGRSTNLDEQQRCLHEAIRALRDSVRFVLISSGESIESVLLGNFREILHSVIRERLHLEFDDAERSRQTYITGLQDSLLGPLRDRLAADVAGMFPEIDAIRLSPEVSSIEQTLSNVGVSLGDIVSTPLEGKGTGVRGGVLVAMLSYLALNATKSMVFAVEEPEAFLHPSAQEDLREHLEQLAGAKDVSLLVTTHSPFTVTRSPTGRVFCLAKDREGRTRIAESAAGDADHASLIGGLLRPASLEWMLASASALPLGTEALVLVEGDGDRFSMELAAELVGRPELLDSLVIRPTGGTLKMVAEAVIARAAVDVPIIIVLDNDDPGRLARSTLTGRTYGFEKGQFVSYDEVFGASWQNFPVEAEDLYASELIESFVEHHGASIVDGTKRRPDDCFHYDFSHSVKKTLEAWLRENARPDHVLHWIELLLLVRARAALGVPSATASELVDAAPVQHITRLASVEGGQVLIVSGQHDYARYLASTALILDAGYQLPEGVTHVGFYSRAIQQHVALIVADHPNLLFVPETLSQLRATGKELDGRVADVLDEAMTIDTSLTGRSHRVLLLSGPTDESTVILAEPVVNTKKINDRPVVWTIGPSVVPLAALMSNPTTTDELERAMSTRGSP